MKDSTSLKVGDLMVKFGEVYQIIRVEKRENGDGKKEKEVVIYYKSYYSDNQMSEAIYSIPIKNLSLTSLRMLISQKELFDLIEILSKPIDEVLPIDVLEFRETVSTNNPFEMAYLIKRIWTEKQEKDSELSRAKSKLYTETLKILSEEIALVKKTSVLAARNLITRALGK